jgi:hypothetical protein
MLTVRLSSPLIWRRPSRECRTHDWQSTAIANAEQISCILASASRPRRSTSTPTDTLSTESRLTADRLGTGSSPGSSTTSLGSARIVVVHGAISARPRRGMTASRESTTTGRRPISGSSHHHSSPRAGGWLMMRPRHVGMRPDRPRHRPREADADRKRRSWRRSRLCGAGQARRQAPRPQGLRRSILSASVSRC